MTVAEATPELDDVATRSDRAFLGHPKGLGYLADDDAARVTAAIDSARLPSEVAGLGLNCDGRALAAHMLHDKKMDAGTLPFVLLRGIGEAFLDKSVSLRDVADFLDEQLQPR